MFLASFPRLIYDINKDGKKQYNLITDIFFRVAFLKKIKTNSIAYFPYFIKDGDTPDIVAHKVFGDSQAYWAILLVNDIVDPQYQWPLADKAFDNFIIAKYGSIATAMTTYHHYEKKIKRSILNIDGRDSIDVEFTSQIDQTDPRANGDPTHTETYPTIPYDTYTSLPVSTYESFTCQSDYEVEVTTTTESISYYDYEFELNEKKRKIKMLYPQSYNEIISEFKELVDKYDSSRRYGLKSARL